jgi:hypothetical protein
MKKMKEEKIIKIRKIEFEENRWGWFGLIFLYGLVLLAFPNLSFIGYFMLGVWFGLFIQQFHIKTYKIKGQEVI